MSDNRRKKDTASDEAQCYFCPGENVSCSNCMIQVILDRIEALEQNSKGSFEKVENHVMRILELIDKHEIMIEALEQKVKAHCEYYPLSYKIKIEKELADLKKNYTIIYNSIHGIEKPPEPFKSPFIIACPDEVAKNLLIKEFIQDWDFLYTKIYGYFRDFNLRDQPEERKEGILNMIYYHYNNRRKKWEERLK